MFHPFWYERVSLPLCKVADAPFHIQEDYLCAFLCIIIIIRRATFQSKINRANTFIHAFFVVKRFANMLTYTTRMDLLSNPHEKCLLDMIND